MKIIILGAGQVGSSVAMNLVSEANDITVIDTNQKALQLLGERYDLRTLQGHASYPSVLEKAGANDADMIIAVTSSDETNMVACQVAYTLFHTPTKIARVRNLDYLSHNVLFSQEALPIDVLINPEQLVTRYVERLISFPGALQVLDFADGKVQMVAIKIGKNNPLRDRPIRQLPAEFSGIEFRVVTIFREGKGIIPDGDTSIRYEDELFIIASTGDIRILLRRIKRLDKPASRIMIAGGGNIGLRLAELLENSHQVKVIEIHPKQAQIASETLKRAVVLQGDATDSEMLIEENVENTDVFCALTNSDGANIISSMLAKRLGAGKVMSLTNRATYVDLVQSDVIDIAISPQQATIGSLLAHIRQGDVVVVHSLRRGAAEAIEAVAHGEKTSSSVVGRSIGELMLPPDTSIGAVVRGDKVMVAHHDIIIESEDHVILLVADKDNVPAVERLFQVNVTFL